VGRIAAVVAGRGDRPIVAIRAQGRAAPPVLVERSHFALVAEARGDAGLRVLLAAHPEWVMAVEAADHPPDVDTPADLDRLRGG
jgi:CTP:molybdopterin cytidylyltransferase MocA